MTLADATDNCYWKDWHMTRPLALRENCMHERIPTHRSYCLLLALTACAFSGCHVLAPTAIPVHQQHIPRELVGSAEPQIEMGTPAPVVDTVGWIVGIPDKVLLWDRRVANHKITDGTIAAAADYLQTNNLPHIKVRANQYAPIEDWKRLTKNKTVAWPWRYTVGALSVAGEAIFPGRIFGMDHFNPYTQTIHLFSDVPAIALHEAGHAKDFTRRKYQGTYAAAYAFVPLWHETHASRDVFAYLEHRGDADALVEANHILYPAYGTYVGGAIGNFFPAYSAPIYYAGVIAGHINGRALAAGVKHEMTATNEAAQQLAHSAEESSVAQVSHIR